MQAEKKCTRGLNCEGCDPLCPFYSHEEPKAEEVSNEE